MLILEIFGERAQSHEGKLQVELARLQYLSTRLVRRWTHLERQRGGIGTRGGPGETQIELDRRMIGERIKRIKERLEKVKRQRSTQRRARERNAALPHLAGRLHQRRQVDAVQRAGQGRGLRRRPAVRDARHHDAPALPAEASARTVSLSDTVGFIRDLPHDADRRLPGDAAGGGRCRSAAARGRRRQSRARRADGGSAARARRDRRRRRAAGPGLQQARPHGRDRAAARASPTWSSCERRARAARLRQRADGEGLDLLRGASPNCGAGAALNAPAEAASGRLDPARSEAPRRRRRRCRPHGHLSFARLSTQSPPTSPSMNSPMTLPSRPERSARRAPARRRRRRPRLARRGVAASDRPPRSVRPGRQ